MVVWKGVKPQRGGERACLPATGFLTLFVPSSHRRRRHALCRRMRTESRQSILLEWKPIGQPPVVFPYTLYLSLSKRDVDDDYECYKFAVWTATMTLSCSYGNTPRGLGAGTIRLPVPQAEEEEANLSFGDKKSHPSPSKFSTIFEGKKRHSGSVEDEHRIPPLPRSLVIVLTLIFRCSPPQSRVTISKTTAVDY